MLNQLQRSVVAPGGANGRSSEEEPIPTLDMLESQKQVKRVVHYLEQRVDSLRDLLDQRDKTLNLAFQFKDWKRNVKTVSTYHSRLPVAVIPVCLLTKRECYFDTQLHAFRAKLCLQLYGGIKVVYSAHKDAVIPCTFKYPCKIVFKHFVGTLSPVA